MSPGGNAASPRSCSLSCCGAPLETIKTDAESQQNRSAQCPPAPAEKELAPRRRNEVCGRDLERDFSPD
jgi:hypothetical protein